MILSLLLALTAQACTFPAEGKIISAAPAGAYGVALAEERSQCLYFVSHEKKILSSTSLEEIPSDIQWHEPTGRLFYYLVGASELRSIAPGEKESRLETRLATKTQCETRQVGGVKMETCREVASRSYKILLGKNELLLSRGTELLAGRIGEYAFRAIGDHSWFFSIQVKYEPESNTVIALHNHPTGESIVSWYVLNRKMKLLSPVPSQELLSSGITNLYFLDRKHILANNGLVYRLNDFALVANLGEAFETAFPAGENLVTISEAGSLAKATIYNSHLRPISFEYFSTRPLLAAAGANGSTLFVMPEGKLSELIRLLPLRKIP